MNAREFEAYGDCSISSALFRCGNLHRARAVASELVGSLSGDLLVRDWTRQNRTWFAAVQLEKRMMFIILTLIVAVAAFNLVSTLVMTVTDKQADIAILRTLGASPRSIEVRGTDAAALDDFRIAFNQHLIAAQIILQAILPGMQASGYGRIINVISTSVKEPIRNLGVSNTIRGAVASWAKTLATELGSHGITVNNVLPGYTRTQRLDQILADRSKASGNSEQQVAEAMLATVPARRFAEAAEIASAIAFLASPAAGYINGINLPVDGGRLGCL